MHVYRTSDHYFESHTKGAQNLPLIRELGHFIKMDMKINVKQDTQKFIQFV